MNTVHPTYKGLRDLLERLPGFLDLLQEEGFNVSMETHIWLLELIKALPLDTPLARIKTILCPLVAKNEQEQTKFYSLFDRHFSPYSEGELPAGKKDAEEKAGQVAKWPYFLGLLFSLVFIIAAVYFVSIFSQDKAQEPDTSPAADTANISDNLPETADLGNAEEPGLSSIQPSELPDDFPAGLERPFPENVYEYLWNNEWLLKIAIIALFLLAALFFELYRSRKRRQLFASRHQNTTPPYIWDIPVEGDFEIDYGEYFGETILQLRQRRLSDQYILNMPDSIQATIRQGGAAKLMYNLATVPAEYLILIDRTSLKNHHANLFNYLYQELTGNEVHIERFFFNGDPRLCWNEKHPGGISLQKLAVEFGQYRLLLFGNASRLINPTTGKLQEWANLFEIWKSRAILTPNIPEHWQREEHILSELFVLKPAQIEGLLEAVQRFEENQIPGEKVLPLSDMVRWPELDVGDTEAILSLRAFFTEDIIRWIAACALFPELNWDLTLKLGEALSTPENRLLAMSNLLQIGRLEWFAVGEIPESARRELIDYLPEPIQEKARAVIIELLESHPPPPQSQAFDQFRMQLAVQKLLLHPEQRKPELEREYEQLRALGQKGDFTVVKYFNKHRNRLDFLLPKALHPLFFRQGHSFFGTRPWASFALAALLCLPLFFIDLLDNSYQNLKVVFVDEAGNPADFTYDKANILLDVGVPVERGVTSLGFAFFDSIPARYFDGQVPFEFNSIFYRAGIADGMVTLNQDSIVMEVGLKVPECFPSLFRRAMSAIDSSDFQAGLNNLQSAKTCAPEMDSLIDDLVLFIFEEIEAQRKEALAQRKEALDRLGRLDSLGKTTEVLDESAPNRANNSRIQSPVIQLPSRENREVISSPTQPAVIDFEYVERQKAALLFWQREVQALNYGLIPNQIREQENSLRLKIQGLKNKLRSEILDGGRGSRAKDFETQLKAVEREYQSLIQMLEADYPEYYRLKQDIQAISVAQLQQEVLQPDQTLVEYFLTDSLINIFVISQDEYEIVKVPRDYDLASKVSDLRSGITKYYQNTSTAGGLTESSRKYVESATVLYQKLFAPIRDRLTSRVIIVPDGILYYIPFEILLSETPQRINRFHLYPYLLKEFQITYSPSATALFTTIALQQSDRKKEFLFFAPSFEGIGLLSDRDGGNPGISGEEKNFMTPLNIREASLIFELMGGRLFAGSEANIPNLRSMFKNAKALHISTHGKFNERIPDSSYIALSDDFLYPWDFFYKFPFNDGLELVVLGAAETFLPESGSKGLGASPFYQALSLNGAKAFVGASWVLNDRASEDIMISFYRFLKSGLTKDEALRRAKIKYLIDNPGEGGHPYYWAPYQLMGDPSPIE